MQTLRVPAMHCHTIGMSEASDGLIQPLRASVPIEPIAVPSNLAWRRNKPLGNDTDAPKAKKPKWLCGTVVMVLMQLMTVLYGLMQM